MAEAPLDSSDCFLCSEELKAPVTLGCDHRFCLTCLEKHWAPDRTGDCPKCRRRASKELPMTFALKEKTESTQRQTDSSDDSSEESSDDSLDDSSEESSEEEWTSERLGHIDKPKVSSQTEASAEELRSKIQSLEQEKKSRKRSMESYKRMIKYEKSDLQSCEEQIRDLTLALHQLSVSDKPKVSSQTEASAEELRSKIQSLEQEKKSRKMSMESYKRMIKYEKSDLQSCEDPFRNLTSAFMLSVSDKPKGSSQTEASAEELRSKIQSLEKEKKSRMMIMKHNKRIIKCLKTVLQRSEEQIRDLTLALHQLSVSDKPKVSSQTEASAEELRSKIQSLEQEKRSRKMSMESYKRAIKYHKTYLQSCEEQIRDLTLALHQLSVSDKPKVSSQTSAEEDFPFSPFSPFSPFNSPFQRKGLLKKDYQASLKPPKEEVVGHGWAPKTTEEESEDQEPRDRLSPLCTPQHRRSPDQRGQSPKEPGH